MELIGLARDDEGDGLDQTAGDLVGTGDLALGDVEGASWDKTHPALRCGGLELGEGVEVVGFEFVVADVSVS